MYLSPLDPSSSIPNSSSVRCENGFKLRKLNDDVGKDNALQIESNITYAQENKLVLSQPLQASLVPHTTEPTTKDNALQIESNITHAQENKLVPSQPLEASLVPHTTEPTTKEGTQRVSAKEQLYKLCGVRHWKPPTYECHDEDGSCNMRLFTVKTTIEMKEDSRITVLECFGDPHNKKKIAAEQAAEAALWYLKNVGHTLQTDKASGR